jgi:hypothetical protein
MSPYGGEICKGGGEMKASEALREGAKQVKGQTFQAGYRKKQDTACAMGCIAIGYGVSKDAISIRKWYQEHSREFEIKYVYTYKTCIANDNDIARRTLEQIAQRLEDIGE